VSRSIRQHAANCVRLAACCTGGTESSRASRGASPRPRGPRLLGLACSGGPEKESGPGSRIPTLLAVVSHLDRTQKRCGVHPRRSLAGRLRANSLARIRLIGPLSTTYMTVPGSVIQRSVRRVTVAQLHAPFSPRIGPLAQGGTPREKVCPDGTCPAQRGVPVIL